MKRIVFVLTAFVSFAHSGTAHAGIDCKRLWNSTTNKDYSNVTGTSGTVTGSGTCYQVSPMLGKCVPYRRSVTFTFHGDGTWSCSCGMSALGDCHGWIVTPSNLPGTHAQPLGPNPIRVDRDEIDGTFVPNRIDFDFGADGG